MTDDEIRFLARRLADQDRLVYNFLSQDQKDAYLDRARRELDGNS